MTWKTSFPILITSLVVIETPVFADSSVFDGPFSKNDDKSIITQTTLSSDSHQRLL